MYEMIGLVESGYERVVCRRSELAWQVVDGGGSMARRKKQPTAQALLLTIPDVAIQLGCAVLLFTISSIIKGCRRSCLGVCILTHYVSGSSSVSKRMLRSWLWGLPYCQ